MCVDTSALLRDLLSHPIIGAVHPLHQPLLQDGLTKGVANFLRAVNGARVRIGVSVAVTGSSYSGKGKMNV